MPILCDDAGGWLKRPVLAPVVTCAARNASAPRQQGKLDAAGVEVTLRRRAAFVLAIAAHHGVDRFVLGAWGAGVFGNDPAMVADAFGALLEGSFAGAFTEVVSAIPGGAGSPNHDALPIGSRCGGLRRDLLEVGDKRSRRQFEASDGNRSGFSELADVAEEEGD